MTTYDEENFVSNSSITLETPEVEKLRPRISLVGIGGGGGNALKTMVEQGLDGVELFAVNTDVQDLENLTPQNDANKKVSKNTKEELLPGSSQPQDLGTISYKDTSTEEKTQKIESVETTASIVTETFQAEEKILPKVSKEKQYAFATSFLKNGDYPTAERAFREFVLTNPEHDLAGNAQYWYAETFRIRQLYTDAASAYLEGYQKYPKGEKAPINLLKLGVSMVQIGEKDQGCKMINGVEKQYPEANQSVIQKAKYESQKFECKKQNS